MAEIQTLDEYQAYMKALGTRDNGKDAAPDTIRLALQAAVLAENLTGDQHWDYYLQCLQGAVAEARSAEQAHMERLADPMLVDMGIILGLKMRLADVRAIIRSLEWAIELPQSIKDTAREVKALDVPALDLNT